MPSRHVAAFALTLLLYCGVGVVHLPAQSASAPSGGYRISGKVISSTTGAPLPQVRVTIADTRNDRAAASVITTDSGAFQFTQLPPGKFALSAAKRGFIAASFDEHGPFSTAIVTGPDLQSEGFVFRLTPEAVLTGKILDESGEGVRAARVELFHQDHDSGVARVRTFRRDQTDDQGTYEFADLPAGDYFLAVNAKPWYAMHPTSSSPEETSPAPSSIDQALNVSYPPTYYPNVTDSDEAVPIPIRGGEYLSVDIHLTPAPALRILVHLSGDQEHGFSFSPPEFRTEIFDSTELVRPDAVRSNNAGIEEMSVPAGKYLVFTHDPKATDGSGGTMSELDLTRDGQELNSSEAQPAASVKLTVRIPGQTHPPNPLVVGLLGPEERLEAARDVNEKGEAEFLGVTPSTYTVRTAAGSKRYSVRTITCNGGTTSGSKLSIPPGASLECVVSLISGLATVQGFAKHDSKGVSGAMIVLVPKDPEANLDLFRRDQSDSDGSFSLPGVIAGEYTIVATQDGWELDWSQPGVIAHYLQHGQKLSVASDRQGPLTLPAPIEVQPR